MKTTLLACGLAALALRASAADFTRAASFDSVDAFVAAALSFQPANTRSDLVPLFTVREPHATKRVTAANVQSSAALWSDDTQALIFISASPPTSATRTCVGVLVLLARKHGSWRIADAARFTAIGKDADVSAELTAGVGTGYHLGSDGMLPVVTVKESHGGRGYSYQASASYTLGGTRLQRLALK